MAVLTCSECGHLHFYPVINDYGTCPLDSEGCNCPMSPAPPKRPSPTLRPVSSLLPGDRIVLGDQVCSVVDTFRPSSHRLSWAERLVIRYLDPAGACHRYELSSASLVPVPSQCAQCGSEVPDSDLDPAYGACSACRSWQEARAHFASL